VSAFLFLVVHPTQKYIRDINKMWDSHLKYRAREQKPNKKDNLCSMGYEKKFEKGPIIFLPIFP